jgi:hypothetical protein
MNTIEDRLRAATKAAAGTVAPGSAPPLRLPADLGPLREFRGAQRRLSRWQGWLVPLTAAAAVAAVVLASVAISGAIGTHRPAARHSSSRGGPLAGLPTYYLNLHAATRAEWSRQAVVRSTHTGAVVESLAPPAPYRFWLDAAGNGNGHEFILAAAVGHIVHQDGGVDYLTGRSKFYLLRIGHGNHPTLTPLPVAVQANQVEDFALSPDGSKLALTWGGGDRGGHGAAPSIEVVGLATGSTKTWTWPGGPRITANSGGMGEVLSFTTSGQTLAYQQWVGGGIDIRLLDTTTPGGSLPASSRLGMRWPDAGDPVHFIHGKLTNTFFGFSGIITPDGSKIAAATATVTKQPLNSELQFTEYAVGSGKVERVLDPWRLPGLYPGQVQDVLWSNSSGSKLIVVAHIPGKPAKDPDSNNSAGYGLEIGVVSGNTFTPIPGAPAANSPDGWPAW